MGDTALIYSNSVGGLAANGKSTNTDRHDIVVPARRRVNRRTRRTTALSLKQAEGVIHAALHAERVGLPFNRHVTLRLEQVGVANADDVRAIGRFLKLFRDWLSSQGHSTAYAWVRESGYVIGSHVHILLHVPPDVALTGSRSRKWMKLLTGGRYQRGAIRTKRLPKAAYAANLDNLLAYLCKGLAPADVAALGTGRHKPGGVIVGKRAGWSENVGQKAIRMSRLSCTAMTLQGATFPHSRAARSKSKSVKRGGNPRQSRPTDTPMMGPAALSLH